MATLPNTGLETHPAGTTNVGGIINANWTALESLFNPSLSSGDPFHNALTKALTRNATLPTGPSTLEWGPSTKPAFRANLQSVAYAGTVDVPATNARHTLITLAGDIVITISALAEGREWSLILQADGTTRNLTWPGSIIWLGTAPATLAAGKTLRVHFLSTTSTASGVIATPDVQP